MRAFPTLIAVAVLAVAPLVAEAQGSRSASTGGTGGQAGVRPGARSTPSVPALPTARNVADGVNPAAELVAKRKKLGLDDATVESLQALAAAMGERQAPALGTYDSLRTQVHMARNRTRGGVAPSDEEMQVNRERVIVLGRTMATVRAQRAKDVEEALAVVPEDKREAAKKALEEQEADLARSFRRSGPEGAAAAGGAGRRP